MKTISITRMKKMPVRQLEKLISRRELQVTRYGKAVAIIQPLGPYFSIERLEDLARQWDGWSTKQKNAASAKLLREMREKRAEELIRTWDENPAPRKMRKGNFEKACEEKFGPRRMEQRRSANETAEAPSRPTDAAGTQGRHQTETTAERKAGSGKKKPRKGG